MNKDDNARRVVITGYGAVTPLGGSASESWMSIMDYQAGYRAIDKSENNIKSRFYGVVDKEPAIRDIPASIRRGMPRFARLGMGAAKEAMAMAFPDGDLEKHHNPFCSGVIAGTGWGGLDEVYQNSELLSETGLGLAFGCFFSMPNVLTAACSMHWNLRGFQGTPVAACATGTIAVGDAFEAIRQGRATMMLAGAGESLLSSSAIWNIDVLGALNIEPDEVRKASCPFSLDRNGFVLSEGGAMLCLERLDIALARGATIYGEIQGYGNYSDAYDFTAPAPDGKARVLTLQHALDQAGLRPDEIDYINAHGTSTQLNDLNETEALKSVFGDTIYNIPVSSTKSLSGHLISAAGSFEAIICLQAISHGVIPATCHLDNPDPQCDLDYVPNTHRPAKPNRMLNISFGFGGANAALVISRYSS